MTGAAAPGNTRTAGLEKPCNGQCDKLPVGSIRCAQGTKGPQEGRVPCSPWV